MCLLCVVMMGFFVVVVVKILYCELVDLVYWLMGVFVMLCFMCFKVFVYVVYGVVVVVCSVWLWVVVY